MNKLNENHELMADGKVDIEDPQVLVALNAGLAEATMTSAITPYVAWGRVQKVLATYHIFIPNSFLEGSDGHEVVPINQFGKRFGQTNDGDFVVRDESDLYLYFEWEMNDSGLFKVFAEVVNGEDLDEILADYDAEVDDINEEIERSEKRIKELRNTRKRILAKVTDRINKGDKYLNHERGYAKRGMNVVKKIDKATMDEAYSKKEIAMGKEDEKEEHKMSDKAAVKTAKQHLKKNPKYYSILKKVGLEEMKNPCWKGYEMVGSKKKNGKRVPNCVPVSEEAESIVKNLLSESSLKEFVPPFKANGLWVSDRRGNNVLEVTKHGKLAQEVADALNKYMNK